MAVYRFTAYLNGLAEATDEAADALFSAGCDDGTLGSRNGYAFVHFDREASSLEAAVRSAIADIAKAGFSVSRIASPEFETIAQVNHELAAH